MYEPHLVAPPQERPRSTRSHSLKSMSQPNLLTPRTKRLYSLPSRPVIPPHITIQGCHDNKDSHSEEEEPSCECSNDSMAWYTPVVGLSCSLVIYAWSCALAYYSTTWRSGSGKREGNAVWCESADLVRMPEINPSRWKMVYQEMESCRNRNSLTQTFTALRSENRSLNER